MGKNNAFINKMRDLHNTIDSVTPQVYACIAIILHREFGWGYVRLNRLFLHSQKLWQYCAENNIDMLKLCEEETGIELRSR